MPVRFLAVDEEEMLQPLAAHAVTVRVLATGTNYNLTTDENGLSPEQVITIGGILRDQYCLYMCKHQGIGQSVLRALELVVTP
jgi:hypothetical protein